MKKNYLIFLLIINALLRISTGSYAQVATQDSLALVDLYNSTDGANWTTKTNWLTGNVSSWYGITVGSNKVTQISLNKNNLTGAIPASFGDLTALQAMYFNNNSITSLPDELANISSLIEIRIENNQIIDFPYCVGKMTQLVTLWITGNNFGGIPFPDTLYNLVNATGINIASCNIAGSLDSRIANWTKLHWMYFGDNELSGSIPEEIGGFNDLTFLELYSNNLEGEIPASIGNLNTLEYLRLYDNQLSGVIPDTIYALTALKEINLHDNYLTGTISPSLGNLTNLTKLYLYNDSLGGSIPTSINSLSNLQEIRIQNNQFSNFPDISSLTNIKYLYVEKNRLTFEDLEPNTNVASSKFTYSPQDSVYTNLSFNLNAGDTLTLLSTIAGSANQYQWYKNGSAISGATDDTLKIASVTSSHTGTYTCKVTSSLVSSLSIYRKSVFVTVDAVTSIPSSQQENSLWSISPNPSESGIYTLQSSQAINGWLTIYDMKGNKINSIFVNQNNKQLDLSYLAKGVYSAKIENPNHIQTILIIR